MSDGGPGQRIRVSLSPVGPPCAIQADDGRIFFGYRVAEDYRPADSEGTYWGRCVSVRSVDRKSGNAIFIGQTQQSEMVGGTMKWATSDDLVDQIEDAEPPPLRPILWTWRV